MSNYCACSGGDEEYSIELNQQGPEGPQGPVGPEGFSPSISVKTNTDKAYVLTVVNKEGNFDTPNLYGETEKLNADLSNIPNPAFINGISLASIENNIPMITFDSSRITTNVDGNLILNATASNEKTMEVFNYEVVANPKEQRLELHDNEGNVKIVATTDYIPTIGVATTTTAGIVKPDGSTITVTSDGTISAVAPDLSNLATKEELASTDATVASIQTSLNNKLEESNIIAGTNITIDRNGNNLTISSIGSGGGGSSIDDGSISSASTWSSSKINSEITTVVETKNDNIFDIGKFTVVGSPTITDDGVASEFSTANYLSCFANSIGTGYNTFEINFKYKSSPESVTTTKYIIGSLQSEYSILFAERAINSNRRFMIYLGSGLSSWDIYSGNGSYNILPNTNYFIKFKFDGTKYVLSYSLDGIIYTDDIIVNLTTKAKIPSRFIFGVLWNVVFSGSIDTSKFSVTIDNEVVFNGLMESTKPIYDKLSSTSTELSTFKTDTDNNFSAVNSALNEKANLSDLASKQNVLTAGENITIEGNVISATGGGSGSGDVTAAGNNTFTGTNTFNKKIIIPLNTSDHENGIEMTSSLFLGNPNDDKLNPVWIVRKTQKGSQLGRFTLAANGRVGIEVQDGAAPSSAVSRALFQLDDTGIYYRQGAGDAVNIWELITTMSNTISSLTDRISALETEINGGNA